MNKFLAALLVMLSAVPAIFADDYFKYIEMADEAVARQDWAKAEELYKAAMVSDPSNIQNVLLLCNVGTVQFYQGNDSIALHTLTEAHAIAPKSTVILNMRAKVLRYMGREDDAILDYSKVIEMDSLNYDAYFNRGYMLMSRNDSIGARRDFEKMQSIAPADPNTLLMLAVMYSNHGDYHQSISYYNQLIDKVKKPEYYTGRAMCRLMLGDLMEASDDIARGLEMNPEDGELYFCRAYLHLLQYREAEAKADAALARRFGVEQERIDDLFQQ